MDAPVLDRARRLLSLVERGAGPDKEQTGVSRAVLSEHGRLTSATILFILDRLKSSGAPLAFVVLAFGPGLAAEAVLIV